MKKFLVRIMANVFPDNCPMAKTFVICGKEITIVPCHLNPFYDLVIEEKLKRLGY